MEVATKAQLDPSTYALAQLLQALLVLGPVIGVVVVRVGRADDVLNAIFDGDAAHLFRDLPAFGPVVYTGQKMTVNINHEVSHCSAVRRQGMKMVCIRNGAARHLVQK